MKLLIALLLLLPPAAFAANSWNERDLNWTAPTACSDGTAITGCVVTGYKLEVAGSCTATTWNALATVGKVLTYHAANLAPGNYCFRVKATSAGGDSAPSATTTASQTTVVQPPPSVPGAPGAVSVTLDQTAYKLRQGVDSLMVVSIGTLPLGTSCDASQTVMGYAVVPRAAVKLASRFDTLPLVALAHCS